MSWHSAALLDHSGGQRRAGPRAQRLRCGTAAKRLGPSEPSSCLHVRRCLSAPGARRCRNARKNRTQTRSAASSGADTGAPPRSRGACSPRPRVGNRRRACWRPAPRRLASAAGCLSRGGAATGAEARVAPGGDEEHQLSRLGHQLLLTGVAALGGPNRYPDSRPVAIPVLQPKQDRHRDAGSAPHLAKARAQDLALKGYQRAAPHQPPLPVPPG